METMSKHPWLQRRRTGYYLRAKVPLDIVEIYGKKEVVRSLRTKELRLARERIHIEAVKVEQEFAECRRKTEISEIRRDRISDEELQRIVLLWFHKVDQDAAIRIEGESLTKNERARAVRNLEIDISFNSDHQNPDTRKFVQDEIRQIQSEFGLLISPRDERYAKLFTLVQRGIVGRDRRKIKRVWGDYDFRSFDPLFDGVSADGPTPELPLSKALTLAELVDVRCP